jgi:hypothetical protein
MLKRCQVLLTDWLEEHMKLVAKRNDLSFSEMIRILLCEGLLHSAPTVYSKYKPKVNKRLLQNITRVGSNPKTSIVKKHQLTSQLYFEARKVFEYLNDKIEQELKNKS